MQILDKKNIEDIIELSPLQEGMFFHYLNDESFAQYHEQLCIEMTGCLKLDLVQQAWQMVVDTNQLLRVLFRWEKIKTPIQIVLKNHTADFAYYNLKNNNSEIKSINELLEQDLKLKFDLSKVPFRVKLVETDENKSFLIVSNHHILYDGWSTGIILNDFFTNYNGLIQDPNLKPLVKPENVFRKYVAHLKKSKNIKALDYWKKEFEGIKSNTDLQFENTDNQTPPDYELVDSLLSEDLNEKLNSFTANHRLTLSQYFYCAWAILLYKYNYNGKNIVFGTTVSDRSLNILGIQESVGLYINTVPCIAKIKPENTIIQTLIELKSFLDKRTDFESVPLSDIITNCCNINREIFNSILVVENYPISSKKYSNSDLEINSITDHGVTNYDITVRIKTHKELKVEISYNKSNYSSYYVNQLLNQYVNILQLLYKSSDISIGNFDFLTHEEKERLLYSWNNTESDVNKEKNIVELFENVARKNNEKVLCVSEDRIFTYGYISKRVNALASQLLSKGAVKENIVGVIVSRNELLIISILGILKAGCAYLPIDPEYPTDRVSYMLEDSEVEIIITDDKNQNIFENSDSNYKILDISEPCITNEYLEINKDIDPGSLAYLIYTSGSTGKPKGILIEQASVINFCHAIKNRIPIEPEHGMLMLTTISFDIFVLEMFVPLLIASKIIIANEKEQKDTHLLSKLMARSAVDLVQMTPSRLQMILEDDEQKDCLKPVKILMIGGESFPENVLKSLKESYKNKIYNMYGPTETTVWSTIGELTNNEEINIGQPILNTQTYILDSSGNLMPNGASGELCIGGEGVLRAYWRNEKSNKEKIIENPFISGQKIFKTGDIARWNKNGELECFGRIDDQVKIRGFRIELGEIENQANQIQGIINVAASVFEINPGNKALCLYYVSDIEIDSEYLIEELSGKIPYYMVPQRYVRLNSLPLTLNGKINRRLLPKPTVNSQKSLSMPVTSEEKEMVKIWSDVLSVDVCKIGLESNFFELGGHSIKATLLVLRIKKELGMDVSISDIFNKQSINKILTVGKKKIEDKSFIQKSVEKREYYSASSTQKRLFALQAMQDDTSFNMSIAFKLKGEANEKKIEEIFNILIQRHESLRVSFQVIDNNIVQIVDDNADIKLKSRLIKNSEIDGVIEDFITKFDISVAPLLRVGLFKIIDSDDAGFNYLLVIDVHHIIADEASYKILIQEFIDLYSGKKLAVTELQYKEFAYWQNDTVNNDALRKQEKYWLSKFSDGINELNLPKREDSIQIEDQAAIKRFELDLDKSIILSEFVKSSNTTMYVFLLSIFKVLLSKYCNQKDIIVTSPVSTRPGIKFQNTIGLFVNMLPMKSHIEPDMEYSNYLLDLKNEVMSNLENDMFQFENIVWSLKIKEKFKRNILLDAVFVYNEIKDNENKFILKDQNGTNKLVQKDIDKKDLQNNLQIDAIKKKGNVSFELSYRTKDYTEEAIELFAENYLLILNQVLEDKSILIKDIIIDSNKITVDAPVISNPDSDFRF
ncbi:MAG: amino acid adenylation domain-containing protein [Bacteroidales bacterium]|nr:amino acid adenylation domain-containing protein [Bacteroidales bacterium]